MVVLRAQDGVDGAAGPAGFAQSHRSDDDDTSDADSLSQSEGGALDAPLLPPENDEDAAAARREAAQAAAEALRACCERGLMLVKCLAVYLLVVSIGAGVLASIAEWVVVAARR